MTRAPNLANVMLAAVVWLTLPLIAATALLLPLQRMLAHNWPEAVLEWVDAEGRLELRSSARQAHDDAVVRSRPWSAARVAFGQQPPRYGYVVGLRREGLALALPDGPWWSPPEDCELALASVDRPERMEWLDCAEIVRVTWPNRLDAVDRLVLAGLRIIDRRGDAG